MEMVHDTPPIKVRGKTVSFMVNHYSKGAKLLFCGLALISIVALSTSQLIRYRTEVPIPFEIIKNSSCPNRFALSDKIRASLCITHQGRILVDIRQFLDNNPTIKGISLTESEYFVLGQIFSNLYSYIEQLKNGT